jgi:hypothetical protein
VRDASQKPVDEADIERSKELEQNRANRLAADRAAGRTVRRARREPSVELARDHVGRERPLASKLVSP